MIIKASLTPDQRHDLMLALCDRIGERIKESEHGQQFLDDILVHGCDGFNNMDDIALAQTTSNWGLGEMLDVMDVVIWRKKTWTDQVRVVWKRGP